MVFLGGHPAKYWPSTIACAVCVCAVCLDVRRRWPVLFVGLVVWSWIMRLFACWVTGKKKSAVHDNSMLFGAHHMQVQKTPLDGNCLFSAISLQLMSCGINKSAATVRAELVSYMSHNQDKVTWYNHVFVFECFHFQFLTNTAIQCIVYCYGKSVRPSGVRHIREVCKYGDSY